MAHFRPRFSQQGAEEEVYLTLKGGTSCPGASPFSDRNLNRTFRDFAHLKPHCTGGRPLEGAKTAARGIGPLSDPLRILRRRIRPFGPS